jgi:hypothetical protein
MALPCLMESNVAVNAGCLIYALGVTRNQQSVHLLFSLDDASACRYRSFAVTSKWTCTT